MAEAAPVMAQSGGGGRQSAEALQRPLQGPGRQPMDRPLPPVPIPQPLSPRARADPLDSAPVPEGLRRAEAGWLAEQLGVAVLP
jgi:hypothetical protein